MSAPGADLIGLRQRVGMVFQSFNLFPHLTVERNVTLALTVAKKMHAGAAGEIAREVLGRVGLADKLLAYPDELSGGQQQRVAIARSLAMRPKVMLLDEITSALDPALVGEVLRVLEQLASDGMTMLLVTHDMDFAREIADQVIFMEQGQIGVQGSPEYVFDQCEHPSLRDFLEPG